MSLRDFILALPPDHAARVAFDEDRDWDCANALAAKTQPGLVPTAELIAYVARKQILGMVQALDSLPVADLTGGTIQDKLRFKGLLKTVQAIFALETVDLQLPEVVAMLDGLIAAGIMTVVHKKEMLLLADNRKPLWSGCTAADVEAARKENE